MAIVLVAASATSSCAAPSAIEELDHGVCSNNLHEKNKSAGVLKFAEFDHCKTNDKNRSLIKQFRQKGKETAASLFFPTSSKRKREEILTTLALRQLQ